MNRTIIFANILIICFLFSMVAMIPVANQDTESHIAEVFEERVIEQVVMPKLSASEFEVNRNWTINIVFVGYDPEIINETRFVSQLPSERVFPYYNLTYNWNVDYNVVWSNESYENELKTFMYLNSVNGSDTGTWLNETALMEMTVDTIPRDCFDSRAGRSINGTLVEDWLIENPAVPTPGLGWTFYLLNYSEIDSNDHILEHWFDYDPFDADTGEKMDWFRLEWDNDLNLDIKYQYSGIGGRDQVYILDASADQWYTNWGELWFYHTYAGAVGPHIQYDLDTYTEGMDLSIAADQENITDYLAGYSWGIVSNLFIPDIHGYTTSTEKASFRVMVFAMDNITAEEIEWIDNEELIHDAISDALPFAEWYIQVDYYHIDDYLDWNTTFWNNAVAVGDETLVDGSSMFYDIRDNLRPNYWLTEGYDMAVFGAVFVKEGMVMQFAGKNYTALGGSRQTVIWKGYERYFRPDGTTHKAGVTAVQIHELGHALGLAHTRGTNRWAADFHYGQMGYFGRHELFATFESTWLKASYLDGLRDRLYEEFLSATQEVPEPWLQKTLDAKENAEEEFAAEISAYDQGEWMDAYDSLRKAENWTKRMLLSLTEDTPPIIHNWGISDYDIQPGDHFIAYVNVSDGESLMGEVKLVMILASVYHLTVELSWNGTYYVSDAFWSYYADTLDLHIEATDQAMNRQNSDILYFSETGTPVLNHPVDIVKDEGELGVSINWIPSDDFPASYEIFINSSSERTGSWNSSSESINVTLDGIDIGVYNYTILVLDTSGNSATDTVIVSVSDLIVPFVNGTDDIIYNEGETGQSIAWTPSDNHPSYYEIFQNGTSILTGSWNTSYEVIHCSVDGLEVGIYNFTVVVWDNSGNFAADTILVTVLEKTTTSIPTDTTTTSEPTDTTTPEGMDTELVITIVIAGLAIVVLILICRRR